MQLKLFHFSKRRNSTKRPADSTATATKNVVMKANTSVMAPVFLLSDVDLAANYCKWNNNYYFIDDISLNDYDMYEIRCSIDALATAKTTILSTSANILYATGSDHNIIDHRIPINAESQVYSTNTTLSGITVTDSTLGTVILGVTGKGSFGAYQMKDSADVSKLLDGIDDWFTWTDIPDMFKQLFYGGSAGECLKSAISLPFTYTLPSGMVEESLVLGNYPCKKIASGGLQAIKAYKINNPIIISRNVIDIDWPYDDWRRNPPYTQLALYLPFVGLINLPTAECVNFESFIIEYAFNITSGDFSCSVDGQGEDTSRIVATASGNVAMPTAYGSTGIDTNKVTTAVISGAIAVAGAIAAPATGGASAVAALGVAGGMASTALNTLNALGGQTSGQAGLGGGASHAIDHNIHLFHTVRYLTDEPADLNDIMGKPYMAKSTISSFSGYVQTEGFSLSGNYLSGIIDMVNTAMDSGVYIE